MLGENCQVQAEEIQSGCYSNLVLIGWPREFLSSTHKNTILKKKNYSYTYQILENLSQRSRPTQILENFENHTYENTQICNEKEPINIPNCLILIPMFAARLYNFGQPHSVSITDFQFAMGSD